MAKEPTVTLLTSGFFSTETLTENFQNIRDQFSNTVSRDGSSPNAMAGDLDMNSNDILNVGTMDIATLTVNDIDVNAILDLVDNGILSDLNSLSLVQGDTLYYDGTNLVRLPIGTTGQVLKVSSGGVPEWGTDANDDTIGVTVQEDGVNEETEVLVINFITDGANAVTSTVEGEVDVDLTVFTA